MLSDERLKDCFMDGLVKGALYTLAGIFFALLIVIAYFFAPEEKTKMIAEPYAVMIHSNL